MAAIVAICLTLSGPYVIGLVREFIVLIYPLLTSERNERGISRPENQTAESQALLGGSEQPNHGAIGEGGLPPPEHAELPLEPELPNNSKLSNNAELSRDQGLPNDPVLHILKQNESSRAIVWEFLIYPYYNGFKLSLFARMAVVSFLLFGCFVAWVTVTLASADIATDKAALSASAHCGIWEYDENAGDEADWRADLGNSRRESRASQYAQNCYNTTFSSSSSTFLGCGFFYQRSIDFTLLREQSCPFPSAELCEGGLFSAIELDTGLVKSDALGINDPIAPYFRRRSSCAPLNMSSTYIIGGANGSDEYEYYYGPTEDTEFTFRTSDNAFSWLDPGYSVRTYFSSLYPEKDYWRPRRELRPSTTGTITIIFVQSMHVYYTEPSFDYIFPARTTGYFNEYDDPYYYNSDPRATVLACFDTTELCSPDGTKCWSPRDSAPLDVPIGPAYWFMKLALENSNTYDSIKWRLGNGLVAQESLSQSVSSRLHPRQWEIEVEQLFATSLARTQYDAMSIATGEGRELAGFIDNTNDEAKGKLCGIFKFQTTQYTNIDEHAFFGLLAILPALFILSRLVQPFHYLRAQPSDGQRTVKLPVLFVLLWTIWYPVPKIWEAMRPRLSGMFQKLKDVYVALQKEERRR